MKKHEAASLIEKYLANTATPNERTLVDNWYMSLADSKSLTDEEDFEYLAQELWAGTLERTGITHYKRRFRFWPQLAAACLLLGAFVFYYTLFDNPVMQPTLSGLTHEIAPGSSKALLMLADGRKISLTDSINGILASQLNTQVEKSKKGSISYKNSQASKAPLVYNILSTPRAAKFEIVLADGTKATLDAASSIRYPVSFNTNERKVEITGQVYFEVAHNKRKPFIVVTKGQYIEVLGTHFNVNSYDGEPALRTTLFEGSVKITLGKKSVFLKPGQEALAKQSGEINIENADTEEAAAWKNGYFRFNNENIVTIMRSISRWYDIDVIYQGEMSGEEYNGTISRYKNISQVLKMLEYSNSVHFKVEGRRVTVSK
ncbi:FecR family protein [Pedobacter frigidisoli]|uniref:FecR family protein n=1 Tax=Pedobacter frigidisoli TaxID=2530455 RepID=A0A4R0NWW0_9SPHI|nr:FecR family protein [Pedobacter frigidisoli]TCD05936.1 FecR family protein [Pedobacter frigidisoli]